MSKQYTVKDVTVERAPGFLRGRFPEVKGLSAALNVIWGPNGIGKTTLGQTLRSLVWKTHSPESLEARAAIETEGEQWSAAIQRHTLVQTRLADNQQMQLPGRNDEMADIYWFSLSDFLKADDRTKPFHKIVYSEMQGGVDIAKAAEEAGAIPKFSQSNQQVTKTANKAKKDLREKRQGQGEVNALSADIRALTDTLAEEQGLRDQTKLLEAASMMRKTLSEIEEEEQKLSLYDGRISGVTTYSYQKFEQLQGSLDDKNATKSRLEAEIDRKTSQLEDCAVSEGHLNDHSIIEQLTELSTNLDESSREKETAFKEFRKAEGSLKLWEQEHTWIIPEAPERSRLASAVGLLKKLSMSFEPVRCRLSAQRDYADLLGEAEEVAKDPDSFAELRTHLKDLIKQYIAFESLKKGGEADPKAKIRAIPFSAGVTAIALILGITLHPLLFLLAIGIPAGLYFLLPSRTAGTSTNQDEENLKKKLNDLNEELGPCGFEPVNELELGVLSDLLGEIEARIRNTKETIDRNKERSKVGKSLEQAKSDLSGLYDQWEAACKEIGLDPGNPHLENSLFFQYSPHLLKWIDLVEAVKAAGAGHETASTKLDSVRSDLKAVLGSDEDQVFLLKGEAKNLASRIERARNLIIEIENNKKELTSCIKDIAAVEAELAAFWKETGFESTDEYALKELAGKRESWDAVNLTLRTKQDDIEKRKAQNPEAYAVCEASTLAEIEEKIEVLQEELADLDEKKEKKGKLISSYEHLIEGSSLAEAEVRYRRALQDLERTRKQQVLGRAVGIMAAMLEKESSHEAVPEVLKQASHWLERITSNRYQLRVNKDDFFAFDMVNNEPLSLEELSDGTRIQLLFAVRMGFITVQEITSGIRLPIFMDELLANTDDERALKVIHAVKEIASERQVFYFTAQGDEVEKFRQHAAEVFHEVALSELFKVHTAEAKPLVAYTTTDTPVPEPVDDYQAYGSKLMVPGAVLWDPIQGLHSWYLFTQGSDLFTYMEQGRIQAGQLPVTDPGLKRRLEILQAAQRTAQIGRSRPLAVSDLEDSDVKVNTSAAYWTQIVEFLAEHDYDGNLLLEALEQGEIKNLRGKVKPDLIDWLEKSDFVNSDTELSVEEVMGRLLAEDADFSKGTEDYIIAERYLHQVI